MEEVKPKRKRFSVLNVICVVFGIILIFSSSLGILESLADGDGTRVAANIFIVFVTLLGLYLLFKGISLKDFLSKNIGGKHGK